jgi:dipeptidyl aminopeptidase/acylaminoacyl peptidase
MGKEEIHAFTWSTTSMSLYFATRTPWSEEAEVAYKDEWKDVIQYREQHRGDTIYRADIENMTISKIEPLTNISMSVVELICSPDGKKLIFSTQPTSLNMERISDYELYSLDLMGHSSFIPLRLTNNSAVEQNLKWSTDGLLFFAVIGEGSIEGDYEDSQGRLYSLNITSNRIERWASQFKGEVTDYALLQGGREGVVILGQWSTEIQVYMQKSVSAELMKQTGWNGSYEKIITASSGNSSTIVFIHSSFEAPQEVYFIDNIDQLNMAQAVTSENKLFTERNLPKGKSYRWLNEDDSTEIEGVLLYPPDKFEHKNLPLFVLIHGGPYEADLNIFRADWYNCGGMMATEGWLVLQPNYRGSTGM